MFGSAMITAGVHYLLAGGMKKRGLLAALTFVFGAALGVDVAQAQAFYDDILAKRRTTAYLHRPPVLVEPVPGPIGH